MLRAADMAFDRNVDRHIQSGTHRSGIGPVPAHNIEGRSVIRAGTDDRQADGHVHAFVEREQLDRDQSLVVIHGQDGIKLAVQGTQEDGVGGERTMGVNTLFAGHDHGRLDDAGFLVAELAVLRGVRVHTADRDAGLGNVKRLDQGLVQQLQRVKYSADVQDIPDCHQRDVDGRQDYFQWPAGEHHGIVARSGLLGEQFRVSGILVAGQFPAFFGDRGRDNRIYGASLRGFDRIKTETHRCFAADL
eukprot:TRINITY_DN27010_c0_g1_i1.p2 TRINITY_DN27010_c0_g1~~TRINITY_DN27010_c0_g1_i1.p2  ORF type:complete len:246 (-),score=5.17 TRINITY_DN27010_c0_g1_i1:175-912(-)